MKVLAQMLKKDFHKINEAIMLRPLSFVHTLKKYQNTWRCELHDNKVQYIV